MGHMMTMPSEVMPHRVETPGVIKGVGLGKGTNDTLPYIYIIVITYY